MTLTFTVTGYVEIKGILISPLKLQFYILTYLNTMWALKFILTLCGCCVEIKNYRGIRTTERQLKLTCKFF
jgi:hypothetical protein